MCPCGFVKIQILGVELTVSPMILTSVNCQNSVRKLSLVSSTKASLLHANHRGTCSDVRIN